RDAGGMRRCHDRDEIAPRTRLAAGEASARFCLTLLLTLELRAQMQAAAFTAAHRRRGCEVDHIAAKGRQALHRRKRIRHGGKWCRSLQAPRPPCRATYCSNPLALDLRGSE